MPIVDPFSGSRFGVLRVLLAMGTTEQVSALQSTKLGPDAAGAPQRPDHYLERSVVPKKMIFCEQVVR